MPGLFDPRPPKTLRQQLLEREAELLAEYSHAGGERRDEIDCALIDLRARLALAPRPAPPAAPEPEHVHRRSPGAIRDGRMAATGGADK